MNQISPFEYVSILVSIILGLGMTQILSSFSDLLYHYKKVKFYWVHSIWLVFVLFLHVQDWFVTYQLKDRTIWHLPELVFVLLYPITLFIAAKMLLPTNDEEEKQDMKKFYNSQFPVIFSIIAISIFLSVLFNLFFLKKDLWQQTPLLLFFVVILSLVRKKTANELIHQALAIVLLAAAVLSVVLEEDVWIIK